MGLRRPTIQFFCFAHHPMRCRTPEGCAICNQSGAVQPRSSARTKVIEWARRLPKVARLKPAQGAPSCSAPRFTARDDAGLAAVASYWISAVHRWSQPVDATLYPEGEMECGLMAYKFH